MSTLLLFYTNIALLETIISTTIQTPKPITAPITNPHILIAPLFF
ncbi:hypothetical protein BN1095_1300117 [Clostridioides difficile]|uniref:Uncharacterized protein n=1 Tax=Clostridioides difficile TaxID=1496 RepID=A0A069AHK7_CLODI|nr:hypothetical protein BN1096_790072 [Clostridioides difficile]CDS93267.1 hypothetical protein BN1095_1300117 [Clostridioides difficile]